MIIKYKKAIIFICLAIFSFHQASAQTRLTGKITDKLTGESIPGATLYFPELKRGTASDMTGSYKIDNLPELKVTVQVEFLGYKTIVEF